MTPRLKLIMIVVLAWALAAPAAALAGPDQESVFEDDFQLLQRGPQVQASTLDELRALGVDTVHSLVQWNTIARKPRSAKRPKHFDATNPAAYPHRLWDRYDDLVRGAQARGLSVLLSPSSPIPRWASGCRGSASKVRACKPSAGAFGAFVQALGKRYSGAYADENEGGGVLPRVSRWSIWNEPNQPGWLSPQLVLRRGRVLPFAADRYRALAAAAIRALRRTGHGSDQILLGETAPIGRVSGSLAKRPIPPGNFIRALFCLSPSGHKVSGSLARAMGCRKVTHFAVNGFAHHPYTRGGSQPPTARVLPGEITISTAARLKQVLAQGARVHAVPRNLGIWYTEDGFQTNPPDRLFGVSLDQQAAFINQSDWIAFRDRRVRSVAQYKLIDEASIANFQTGLRFFRNSVAKPSYDAYKLPIWVVRRGSKTLVYGQVRPAPDSAHETVAIQHRTAAGAFTTVATVDVSSLKGQFTQVLPVSAAGEWRLSWAPTGGGATLVSRVAKASPV